MTRAWSPRSVTAFTAALLIHAAAIGGVLMEFPRPDAAAHPGAGGVMLIVAATAAGSSAGSRKAAQETAPETAPAPEPKLKPEATPPQALAEKHLSPVDVETHVGLKQVVQITPGKTATLSAPKPVPVPKRKPRPPAETVTQATPEPPAFPRKPAEETQTTGISEAAETTVAEISPASPAATNGEQGLSRRTQIARSGGGHVSELGDYLATVRSWLHDHKRYPRRARLRMLQGDATIGFVLDRSGRVVSYTLQKSSGHDMLDREVLAMIRRASPMPPIPPSLARNQMDFSVPVRFDMR